MPALQEQNVRMIKALEDKKTRSIITVVAGLICVLCLVYIAMTLFGGDRPPPYP